ncbi:hypothetical protein [Streptomyces sp. 2A115]|uniref:hypothetical protein n=1 Tax=Streptomyces sp. 2A115 TaxID=3457439 RepID=UPI003FD5F45D
MRWLTALLQHTDQLRLLRERPGGMPIPGGRDRRRSRCGRARRPAGRGRRPVRSRRDPAGPRRLAFGHGIHHCRGAPLARLETTIALRTLLSRVSELELPSPAALLEWIGSGVIHGELSLPVRYRVG